ncbi:MAG: hypothetical protein IJL45_05710 [Prevotella sp.]|nr:hypothetical protein [Prevotella sp.]MBQ6162378.1 hypothetical protein [Prevotella sp.]MBQ6187857.1 hypothetical protein [Prevotella sp.]
MKKLFTTMLLVSIFAVQAQSQEIYKEVKRLMQTFENISSDTKRDIQERKVAVFKADALYYLIDKAGMTDGFTEYQLGQQADAMIEFVNLYVKKLQSAGKNERKAIMARFKNATMNNALFGDMEKEVVYGYVDNENFITQFSIDTNWIDALKEVKR